MAIHDTLFKLATLGDSTVIAPEMREAVKAAYAVLQDVRNLMGLGASEEMGRIVECVRHCVGSAPDEAFAESNIARSVLNLRVQHSRLADALEHIGSQEEAAPLEVERRIIQETLSAVDKEYGPKYFDKVGGLGYGL